MKLNKIFSAFMLIAAVTFAACSGGNIPDNPNQGGNGDTTTVTPNEIPDIDIPEGTLTVAEARAICEGLESGQVTPEKYYVKGWIKKLQAKHESAMADYGNAVFFMADEITDSDDFEAYQVYGKNGQKFTSLDEVAVGDYVVVYGQLTNYNGTFETVGQGAAYVYSSSNPNFGKGSTGGNTGTETPEIPDEIPSNVEIPANAITVAEACAICAGLAADAATSESYYVKGWIKDFYQTSQSTLDQYGNASFHMIDNADDTSNFMAFQVFGLNGEKLTSMSQVAVGDYVVIYGPLTNYKGNTYETTGKGTAYIYSSSNPNIADGGQPEQPSTPTEPETPVEGDVQITFNKSLGDWTYSGFGDFYSNGGLKVNSEGATLTSPLFNAANTVDVTFTIGAFNDNTKTGINGKDGNNFKIEGLDATGAVVATQEIKTPEAKSYTVTLNGNGISKVAITMVSFPYNEKSDKYCNVNLSSVSIVRK